MEIVRIEYDPAFIEEIVFLAVKAEEEVGNVKLIESFHHKRTSLYEEARVEVREQAFLKLYDESFRKMGIAAIFEEITGEFPVLGDPSILVFIKRAWSGKEEGAELFQQGSVKTVLFAVQPIRILIRSYLEAFLRHELMHVADMLDPQFEYSPHPALGGENEIEDNLIRGRFRLLWNLYVDARLRGKGFIPIVSLEKRKRDFEQVFSFMRETAREQLFQDITKGRRYTQAQLLKWAGSKAKAEFSKQENTRVV